MSLRVGITGASGLIGKALAQALSARGDEPVAFVRHAARAKGIPWDPAARTIDRAQLEGLDAVVHLAGEPVAGRWTAAKKAAILKSREDSTKFLCTELAQLDRKPAVLVSGSAIGIYGSRGDEMLDERSAPGSGFLAEVCEKWEAACGPAREAGIRVVNLRTGIVLSGHGGALEQMLTPFRLGVGGRLGDGAQYMSWIALGDLVGGILHAITQRDLAGPMNGTAPNPVTNAEFTRVLGKALQRPTLLPAPAFALRTLLGQMADEMLLGSARVLPRVLLDSGYDFRYPTLPEALAAALRDEI